MNPVVHFEMPYEDRDRMVGFYQNVFGWKAHLMGPEMGEYAVMQTTETDEKNMIKEPGRINGGFYKKNPEHPNPSIVISVDDITAAMKKVTDAGGKVVGDPVEIPGVGRYVAFFDPEGNAASMLQPKTS